MGFEMMGPGMMSIVLLGLIGLIVLIGLGIAWFAKSLSRPKS